MPSAVDVVASALRREADARQRRADAADTKAGLVLGFAGILVSLGMPAVWPPLAVLARLLAASAALAALWAGAPEDAPAIDVTTVDRVTPDAAAFRGAMLAIETDIHRDAVTKLGVMVSRVRIATLLLAAAVVTTALAVTVESMLHP